ncbi:MAG: ABC transporter permease [Bacteroidales bacterium]|nr:ABC transporter permease [Bacteroidales bacterium]
MKILLYIKHAFAMMRHDLTYTVIYVAGTAIAISTVTILSLSFYSQFGHYYPERNRDRVYTLGIRQFVEDTLQTDYSHCYSFSPIAIDKLFADMKTTEAICAELTYTSIVSETDGDSKKSTMAKTRRTTPGYFKIYELEFIEGKPFTQTDIDNNSNVAVIGNRTAKQIFKTDKNIVGRKINIGDFEYTICGMVREVSPISKNAYANIWTAYSESNDQTQGFYHQFYYSIKDRFIFSGPYDITFMLSKSADQQSFRSELESIRQRFNNTYASSTNYYWVDPYARPQSYINETIDKEEHITGEYLLWVLFMIFSVLLLIAPAINLSGMAAHRMDERIPELGIRKAFGANRWTLLNEVLSENLVLTIVGGIVGLFMTWFLAYALRSHIMQAFFSNQYTEIEPFIEEEFLFAPAIFVCAFIFCIILNIMATLIPALFSLKKPIVESMMQKR